MLVNGISVSPRARQNVNFSRVVKLNPNQIWDAANLIAKENEVAYIVSINSNNLKYTPIKHSRLSFKISDEDGNKHVAELESILTDDIMIKEDQVEGIVNSKGRDADYFFLDVSEYRSPDAGSDMPFRSKAEAKSVGKKLYLIEGEKLERLMKLLSESGLMKFPIVNKIDSIWLPSSYAPTPVC